MPSIYDVFDFLDKGEATEVFSMLCIGWFIFAVLITIYLYIRNYKPYKTDFRDDFYTQIPSNITPIELSELMYKKVVPSALSAEVLKLFNEGVLRIEKDKNNGETYIHLNRISNKDFTIGKDYTVKLLVNIMGNGSRVSIKEIAKFCDRKRNCDNFYMEYKIWCRIMRKENLKHIFYERKTQYGIVRFLTIIGCLLFIANIIGGFRLNIGYATLLPAVLLLLYFTKIYKRTREANEEYHKWIAFKQFLENIENFKCTIMNPDEYVVYGVVLGVKGLEKKITEHTHYEEIANALNKCIIKALLNGDRKLV